MIINKTKEFKKCRTERRKLIRQFKALESVNRVRNLMLDPSVTFANIRRNKIASSVKIDRLTVGGSTYY